jgi:WD40 repeat protein
LGLGQPQGNRRFAANIRPPGGVLASWRSVASNGSSIGGTIRLWDAVTGNEWGRLEGHTARISTLIFSADGLRLYSAGCDQTIRIWDVRQQRCMATLRGSRDLIYGMALSPDGRTLVSADRDGVVAFWDAHPRPQEAQPKEILVDVNSGPAFAPSGRILAAPRDGVVTLLDLITFTTVPQEFEKRVGAAA